MNREDLAKLYEKANGWSPAAFQITMDELERFAALVAAAAVRETSAEYRMGWNDGQINEREACAQLCDHLWESKAAGAYECATAIRARGQQ